MAIAAWSDELATGVEEVDSQHRELVTLVNELAELARNDADVDRIEAGVAAFRRHVEEHFAWEERYMVTHNPSRLASHRALHEILVGQLDEVVEEMRADRFRHLDEVLKDRVVPWLVEHIVNVDKRIDDPLGRR
jgi:hemerythrin